MITPKTSKGAISIQEIFEDKSNFLRGITKEEFLSLYYNIPLDKILKMNYGKLELMWGEIKNVRRYLRNRLHFAVEYLSIGKGVVLINKEFGERTLKRKQNIYFKISNTTDANIIDKRYKHQAHAFYNAGENVILSAEQAEKEMPVKEVIAKTIRN